MERKQILCYGDSNTWGFMPGTGMRYPADVRWTADPVEAGFTLTERLDFSGSSHKTITREVYVR